MKRILALIFLIIYAGISIYAFDIPKKPNPERLVNDYTNTLSGEEKSILEQKVVAYDDSSSNQVAIVLINSLDGNDIESISDKKTNHQYRRKIERIQQPEQPDYYQLS